MKHYIVKRLLHLVVIVLGVSFLTFLLLYLAPGDPAQKKLTAQGVAVSQEVLETTREQMGLNRPFLVQYGQWLMQLLHGNLGQSYKDGMEVAPKIAKALRYTTVLAVGSLLLSLVVALPLSVWTAVKKDGVLDHIVRLLSFIGNSLPNFLISVLLMYFFCIQLKSLPVIAGQSVKGLLLPCLALSIPMCSRFIRQFRAEILEQLSLPYVTGASIRGVRMRFILFRNVLHNALVPILTIVGLSIGTLFGGSVVIETIFRWPGLGQLAMNAISDMDYPVVQGFVIVTSGIYVLINLITDVLYHWVDPRVREV